MNQYLVTGYDYTDEGALDRRMAVRPHHLEAGKVLKEKGCAETSFWSLLYNFFLKVSYLQARIAPE